ncbi:MAG: ABC transporter ATP-binding protein [Gammaproteobacteria bacterium]
MNTIVESATTMRPDALTNTRVAPKAPCALASAIRVSQLSKCYQIYDRPQDRLKQTIIPRLQRLVSPFFRSGEGRVYFREFWALQDVSFDVKPGETLGILGRNGAGKSTLLQIIAGTLTPTSGGVEVNGRVAALLELGSGFNPEFTGRENVYLNAAILGLTPEETDAKFEEIAAFADIGDFIEQPIKTYSSGMMVRLAFAVQTAVEPSVLIVDEALAVGDARFQKKCYEHLERYRQKGGTVIFVTHDTGIVVQVCSRAMVLEHGRILEIDEPHRIAKVYHRLLFGDPNEPTLQHKQDDAKPRSLVVPGNGKSLPYPSIGSGVHSEGGENQEKVEAIHGRELRYGSLEFEIFEVGIRDATGNKTTLLESGDEYVFYFKVRYVVATSEPVSFGFTITNTRGVEIYGTKGGLHGCFLPAGGSGVVMEARMQLRMRQVPGECFLTVAVAPTSAESTSEFFDMRFDALQFRVIGNPRCFTTSMVDLGAELSYEAC